MASFNALKQVFYGITPDGEIHWHKLVGAGDGRALWSTGSGTQIGSGWEGYSTVISPGAAGILYGLTSDGDLYWHCHLGCEDGTPEWEVRSGTLISGGWNAYSSLFVLWNILYGVLPNGDLYWFPPQNWLTDVLPISTPADGQLISHGWNQFDEVFTSFGVTPDGTGTALLYGRAPGGDLYWFRHDGWYTGTPAFVGSAKFPLHQPWQRIGNGWDAYRLLLSQSPGEFPGIIYGITADGVLRWYRHDGWADGTPRWTAGNGGWKVGAGFDKYAKIVVGHHRLYNHGDEGSLQPAFDDVIKDPRPIPLGP
jgi:hypothetical protein